MKMPWKAKNNVRHHWGIVKVAGVGAGCVVCGKESVCHAYDHDLQGLVCAEDFDLVLNAEAALVCAGIDPTNWE